VPTKGRTAQGRPLLPGEGPTRDALLRAGLAAARSHRRQLVGTNFVGVTGSGGKTTTKDLIAAVLGTRLTGTKTPGSENRLTTVGRTILETKHRDGFCVAEIPAFEPGSVAEFSALLRPTVGVVTVVGLDHYKSFRNRETIAAEKRKLLDALPDDGVAVLNADDPDVLAMAEGFRGRVISFGLASGATLQADELRSSWPETLAFTLHAGGKRVAVRTQLNGKHWVTSVLAALAVAQALGIPLGAALEAIAAFEPLVGRMSVSRPDGVTFLRDDFKAPLWSIDTVLAFLAEARADRKVIVLGTISDYPGSRTRTYRRIAKRALMIADDVVFVGSNARHVRHLVSGLEGERLHMFRTVQEAAEHLARTLRGGELVVLKGSNRADHLARLALARSTQVRCWSSDCRRVRLCDDCRLLRVPDRERLASSVGLRS